MELARFSSRLYPICRRSFHTTPVVLVRQWRRDEGLPVNKTTYGPLTDLPDYTYLDGRPTPLGFHQKHRMLKQKGYAEKIVEMSSELDFAKQRIVDMEAEEQRKRDKFEANRLKPKGYRLMKKS